VDFEFDNSMEQHADATGAMKSYAKFVHENFEQGDEELMRHSLEVLERVAASYSRKKEQNLVNQVKNEIKEVYKEI
jgi:hypothetical protein